MKKFVFIFAIFVLFLSGCSNQNMDHAGLDSKAVEPGEEPSENIADYLETEDTTPPEIKVKRDKLEKSGCYFLSDIVEITDESNWEIVQPGNLVSMNSIVTVYNGMTINLEVSDQYGNTSKKEIVLYVPNNGEGIPEERRFESFVQMEFEMDYSYALMTDENFEILKKAYYSLNRDLKAETGNKSENTQKIFLKMLRNERMIYQVQFLADGRKIYTDAKPFGENNEKGFREKEIGEYKFFDVDQDQDNELIITEDNINYVYDYHKEQDLISEYTFSNSPGIVGSGVIYYEYDGQYICKNICDDGETIRSVDFQSICISDDITLYTATLPRKYNFTKNELDSLREQAYYIQEENYLCFNLTKEQFEELEAMFSPMAEQEKEVLAGVTYTYDELITLLEGEGNKRENLVDE